MSTYDSIPPVLWDEPGVTFDSGPSPITTRSKMKVALNITGLTALELIQYAQDIHALMTGNANFPTPAPTLVALQAQIDAAQAALDAAEAAFADLRTKRADRRDQSALLAGVLEDLAAYVQNASGGDEAKILSSGMSVKQPPVPVGPLPQPVNLQAAPNGSETSAHLSWDRIRGADSYLVETAADSEGPWTFRQSVTRTEADVLGLPTGSRCYFRVRAVGAAGPSPWSDIAMKIVGA
jgi:hypothetical protein